MTFNRASVGETDRSDPKHHARRRWPAHIVVPTVVAVAIGAVVLVSARQVLRPATPVDVRPVVFTGTSASTQPTTPDTRRGATVQAPGWLEADPFYVACTALTDGIVETMLVLEGQRVEAGQIVARLVAEDAELALAASAADLATAEGHLAVVEADVRAARTDWENPVERQRAVSVWQAALAETEAELVQLPALVDVEQARLERLSEELSRARTALERGGATTIEVIILDKQTAAQAATMEAIRRKKGILTARRDRRRAEVAAAIRNFELRVDERQALDAAEATAMRARALITRAKARRDQDKLWLHRTVIRAPITGLVQRRLKVPGDKIMMSMDDPYSAHLVHLYDPEHLQVRVDVPLALAAGIFVGQRCEVVVDILPDETFVGDVTRITHEADLQKNTLQVKVRVFDPDPVLKPEMLTRVRFLAEGGEPQPGAAGPSLRVPAECLSRLAGTDETRVWVVRDRRGRRGRSMPVPVVVQEQAGEWVVVQGDLSPGDLLVVGGDTLSPGQPVRIRQERGAS
jgi:RND family efflux transporter MFP subunit